MVTKQATQATTLARFSQLPQLQMKTFFVAVMVGAVAFASGPTFAQEKKAEPTKEEAKKADAKAKTAEKAKAEKAGQPRQERTKSKKKVKKGGC